MSKTIIIKLEPVAIGLSLIAILCIILASVSLYSEKAGVVSDGLFHTNPAPKIDLDKLASLVNENRTTRQLNPLNRNSLLDKSAQAKCDDMVKKDYWSHNDPDGITPWQFFNDAGVEYRYAAENLAYGFNDAKSVDEGWINSESHKANILDGKLTNVGYAQCRYSSTSKEGEKTLVVQHFAKFYNE